MFVVKQLYKFSFKYANKVFVLNKDDYNFFINKNIVKKEKLVVIPGIGINAKKITPSFNTNSNKVVMIARLIKNKGIMDFCEIARMTRKNNPNIDFDLYGPEAEITRQHLQEFINDGSITYKGYTTDPLSVYRGCDIFVLPSYYREGMPMTLLEAMACGKPCIAYDVPGCRDAIYDGFTGYLIKKGDINCFSNKILCLINDDNKRCLLGKNARELTEDIFSSVKVNYVIINTINSNLIK